jgi:hypothetical protein
MNKEYKALFVKVETHKKFAVKARQLEKTFDQLINYMLKNLPKKK